MDFSQPPKTPYLNWLIIKLTVINLMMMLRGPMRFERKR